MKARALWLGVPLLLMTGCTFAKDALVINPCDMAVTVRLSSRDEPPQTRAGWDATVRVPANSIKLVENAFLENPDGPDVFSARVGPFKRPFGDIRVLERQDMDWAQVRIPDSICPRG